MLNSSNKNIQCDVDWIPAMRVNRVSYNRLSYFKLMCHTINQSVIQKSVIVIAWVRPVWNNARCPAVAPWSHRLCTTVIHSIHILQNVARETADTMCARLILPIYTFYTNHNYYCHTLARIFYLK